ncbi:hypothetical protein J6590_075885 [Homalodisca vitripennis]|nr:hypothetical protein J6590_075885 [Homalodisca vitripennis]
MSSQGVNVTDHVTAPVDTTCAVTLTSSLITQSCQCHVAVTHVCLPSVRLCNIRGQAVSKNQHPLRLFLQAIFDHFRNSERSGITPAD